MYNRCLRAGMAKLVDAPGLGPDAVKRRVGSSPIPRTIFCNPSPLFQFFYTPQSFETVQFIFYFLLALESTSWPQHRLSTQ